MFFFQIDEDISWSVIKPHVFAVVMDFFASGLPVLTEEQPPSETSKLGLLFIIRNSKNICSYICR